MSYVYNAWYVAAWSDEISEGMFARTLLDIPVVLFRKGDGEVAALHDMCPHRFAPLSLGKIVDRKVRCGYHGLEFDTAGNCVGSCLNQPAPKAARVRAFPVFEQDKLIWIWMGDLPAAPTSTIYRFLHHTDPALRCNFGLTLAKADYRLLSDNLMDLSHTATVHPAFGGLDYLAKIKSWEEGDQVIAQFRIENMPSFIEPGSGRFVDHQDEIRWIPPSNHHLISETRSRDSNETLVLPSAHILTPETPTSTHYFWSSAFDASHPIDYDEMQATLVQAFDHEDKPMVEAVQRRMGHRELWDMDPILLANDAGAVRMRRKLRAMIEADQAGRSETAQAR